MAARKEKREQKKKAREKKQQEGVIQYFDYTLLAVVIFLMCFGLVMLYSTSSYSAQGKFGDSMYFFKRQAFVSIASILGMLVVAKINYHWYAKRSKYLYIIAFILMALVLTPLGIDAYGARRWIKLPLGQQMQPSEVMKIAIILFIPYLICQTGSKIKRPKEALKVFAWGVAAAFGVYILTDNLSTGIIVLGMVSVLLVVVYPKSGPIVVLGIVACIAGYVGLHLLGGYLESSGSFRMERILVWLNPEEHTSDGGFQVIQGLYAIGSGGFFGKGLGNSVQKKLIPEAQNDMILAIICEELGVFGAIVVLLLFAILLYRLVFIARNAPDLYGSLIVTGIFAHIALQVLFNVCVVLNVIPTTGITLPFISYGGTSIIFLMAEMGLALGVSSRIRFEE